MKFLCDNCKAKYQIADEKVAGKTVRMKCRKCGHQIEVRAAITETSVSARPPQAPRPAAQSSLATSLSAQKPRAPMAPQAPQAPSALAGAFQRTFEEDSSGIQNEPPGAPSQQPVEISVSNEWYVAINGVPVGPVRIGELRRKAAAGAVTEDSLCWQEGLEEWRPVRSIPDLAALVREAALGNRPSLLGDAPRPPSRIPPPPAPRPLGPARPEPTRPMAPSAPPRSNVVPLHPHAGPLASPHGGAAAALAPAPSIAPQPAPFASLAPSPNPTASTDPYHAASPDPFAVPPAPIATASLSPSYAPPAATDRRGVPLWFWPVLVLALGFGGGLAFMIFRPPATPPVVIHMPPAATTTGEKTADNHVPPPATTETTAPTTTGSAAPKHAAVAAGGGKTAAAPQPTSTEKKTADLSGLLGGGGTGPSGGPASGGAAGGGQGLDSAAVERVVGQHRAGVKRTCWERVSSDKGNVSVTVSATVAPDGSVSNASSSGDDPMVGKCIENQVKNWRFPAPGSTTTVNIPFKFFRQ